MNGFKSMFNNNIQIQVYFDSETMTSPGSGLPNLVKLEMLLIPNALCWSSWKCNCACALPAEVQLCLRVTRRSWQKLFAGKNFIKILVTAQTQLRSYSEQQRAFGNSNICNCTTTPWASLIKAVVLALMCTEVHFADPSSPPPRARSQGIEPILNTTNVYRCPKLL